MQSSLGVYIENNVIKYAKVSREKDDFRVESCNVVFYNNDLSGALNRIISETYSYKTPISINVSNEIYNEFMISTLLNAKDTRKAVQIEYDMLCSEKGYSESALEHRYLLVDQKEVAEKQKTISIIANKNELSKKIVSFGDKKINTMTPITVSIANLLDIGEKENAIIVNIEDKTKITTIVEGQIYDIEILEEGMSNILNEINRTENSYSKSYELCKNTTVYTSNARELYTDTNEYMDLIMDEFNQIISKVKEIIGSSFSHIDRIFITGLGVAINNIDVYFQENIPEARCEILKPFFVDAGSNRLPIKEYIEVNSAIALALESLGMQNRDINFTKPKLARGLTANGESIWKQEINMTTIKGFFSNFGMFVRNDFKAPMSVLEKTISRISVLLLMLIIFYTIFSNIISVMIENKNEKISEVNTKAISELAKIQNDIFTISTRTEVYEELVAELTNSEDATTVTSSRIIDKDAIPNLLNRIMFVIPKKVKLTSIQNTTDTHIVIEAEAEKYEQLGYFKAVLTTNEILKNVKSTSGQKTDTIVKVTIEGDLP